MSVIANPSAEVIKLFCEEKKIKTAMLGGTFNPPHNAHIQIAKSACSTLGYERVIFVPNYMPPHKDIDRSVDVCDRLAMTKLASEEDARFCIESYEAGKKSVSYTIDTVNYIYEKYSDIKDKLALIIGSDLIEGFHLWKDAKILSEKTNIIIFKRELCDIKEKYKSAAEEYNMTFINSDYTDISSTKIRENIKDENYIKKYLPPKVLDYIKKRNLYNFI